MSMNKVELRNVLEKAITEAGGKVIGGGSLMVAPYTTDFSFEIGEEKYTVQLYKDSEMSEFRKDPNANQEGIPETETGEAVPPVEEQHDCGDNCTCGEKPAE